MNDSRVPKMVLFGELEYGSRPVGRPKLRFKDNCKQLLKRIDLLDWNVVALDRPLWRSKIQFACEMLNAVRMERYQRKKERRKRFFFKNVFSTNLLSNYMLIYARLRAVSYTHLTLPTIYSV